MALPAFRPHSLHAPLVPCLRQGLYSLADLNTAATTADLRTGGGLPLRFVPPGSGDGYEASAYLRGEVETRPDNWHDLFGAWVWLAFPRSKAVMNRLHWEALQKETGRRGPVRDALTQFDECGVVVLSTDRGLWQDICQHRWREVFAERRDDVQRHLRFLVFGHASHDALQNPFIGLCGKAVCFDVAELPTSLLDQVSLADRLLADYLVQHDNLRPRCWQPLPLLGIPGATPDNERLGYYDDHRQFRPLHVAARG